MGQTFGPMAEDRAPTPVTPKARMLAAYRGLPIDRLPVAPEFWYYIPAKLLGVDMVTFEREVPHWQALQHTFNHYGTEGWGVVGPAVPAEGVNWRESVQSLGEGRYLARITMETPHGDLTMSRLYDRFEPSWSVERPIKDLVRDLPAYRAATLGEVGEADWSGVRAALDAVGEDYLLEVGLGVPFFDYVAGAREGGIEAAVADFADHERLLLELQEQYVEHVRRLARSALADTCAESLFIGCSWSCMSLLSPSLWRKWDKPVIRAAAEEAQRAGGLLHVHMHGRCRAVLADLAECGVDCLCPLERPPGGDIADLGEARRLLADRVTVNGNVHTVDTLIRGTAADVRDEVARIIESWGHPLTRLIVGTGDQVGYETPDENIEAMLQAAHELGRYSGT